MLSCRLATTAPGQTGWAEALADGRAFWEDRSRSRLALDPFARSFARALFRESPEEALDVLDQAVSESTRLLERALLGATRALLAHAMVISTASAEEPGETEEAGAGL